MLMNQSQFIFKNNEKHKHIRKQWKLIFKNQHIWKRNKVNTTQWRTIYKVTEEAYFEESDIFPDDFIKQCKDNENKAQFVPLDVKNKIKKMSIEQGLYTQVVKLRQKYLKFIAANKNKNENKFKFQGLSARSKRWFDLGFDWIGLNLSICGPHFYKKPFQIHDGTQDTNTFKFF